MSVANRSGGGVYDLLNCLPAFIILLAILPIVIAVSLFYFAICMLTDVIGGFGDGISDLKRDWPKISV